MKFKEWLIENVANTLLINALKQLANEVNQFQIHYMSRGDGYPLLGNEW